MTDPGQSSGSSSSVKAVRDVQRRCSHPAAVMAKQQSLFSLHWQKPQYQEFLCTQYPGTESKNVVTGLCKMFPVQSGIGLLKAFNNRQTLTLFFLNIFPI